MPIAYTATKLQPTKVVQYGRSTLPFKQMRAVSGRPANELPDGIKDAHIPARPPTPRPLHSLRV